MSFLLWARRNDVIVEISISSFKLKRIAQGGQISRYKFAGLMAGNLRQLPFHSRYLCQRGAQIVHNRTTANKFGDVIINAIVQNVVVCKTLQGVITGTYDLPEPIAVAMSVSSPDQVMNLLIRPVPDRNLERLKTVDRLPCWQIASFISCTAKYDVIAQSAVRSTTRS